MWAVVRPPTEELRDYRVTELGGRREIDVELARRQHEHFVDTLRDLEIDVVVVEAMTGYPESTFVEDAGVLLDEGVLVPRITDPSRRAEQASVLAHLPDRMRVELPEGMYLDGGDVVRIGKKVLIGVSHRTGPDVVSWVGGRLLDWEYQVVAVPLGRGPHLTMVLSAARPDLILVDSRVVSSASLSGAVGVRTRLHAVADETAGANVLPIGSDGPVLVSAAAEQTIRTLEAERLEVIPIDVSELEKAGGAISRLCLMW